MNVFALPAELPGHEVVERLAGGADVRVERIVSTGQRTPAGEWLEQPRDEWVVLLQGQAELSFSDGTNLALGPGDDTLIPANCPHRVERTSYEPPCIWLAVHAAGLTG